MPSPLSLKKEAPESLMIGWFGSLRAERHIIDLPGAAWIVTSMEWRGLNSWKIFSSMLSSANIRNGTFSIGGLAGLYQGLSRGTR